MIANLTARGDPSAVEAARQLIVGHGGWAVEVMRTEVRGHGVLLAEEAAAAGVELVGAVGGDGTAREVAAGLAGSPSVMLIIPAGSDNSSYQELFGTISWTRLLATWLDGGGHKSVDLNLIQPTGELSLLGFSAGWLAQVWELAAAETNTAGRPRYVVAAQAAAAAPISFDAQVDLDGRRLADGRLCLVAAGGARVRGGRFALLPQSSIDDGLLEVLCVEAPDSSAGAELMKTVMEGRDHNDPRVHRGRGTSLRLRSSAVLPAEVDGDLWDRHTGETRVEVAPAALRVVRVNG